MVAGGRWSDAAMYNTSSGGGGLLGAGGTGEGGATPRTPEILNSLIAMTNPFDALRGGPRVASSPPSESTSSSCGSTSTSPPSVQHTCSQLIKEGLKLTIQTKRRNQPSSSASDDPPSKPLSRADELTPEDEERRRRRRERNKIAATKCRLKKRERTVNLVQESEILETQNYDLKSQIQDLENERKRLVDMLSVHTPTCSKQLPFNNIVSPPGYQEPYSTCTSSVEPRPNHYSNYSTPYCKVEVNSGVSYEKSVVCTVSESAYQKLEVVEDGGFSRPNSASVVTYHTFEQGVAREPGTVLPFCRLIGEVNDNYSRLESGYSSLSLESSPAFLRTHSSSSKQYSRPSALVVSSCSDYESNKDILDSPSVAPSYHHFDEDADNYSAGFPSGSCMT